jgi:hypothetical protein
MTHPLARKIAHVNDQDVISYEPDVLEQLLDSVITLTKERCIQSLLSGEMGALLEPEARALESLQV